MIQNKTTCSNNVFTTVNNCLTWNEQINKKDLRWNSRLQNPHPHHSQGIFSQWSWNSTSQLKPKLQFWYFHRVLHPLETKQQNKPFIINAKSAEQPQHIITIYLLHHTQGLWNHLWSLAVTGSCSIGECSRLSQPSWLYLGTL